MEKLTAHGLKFTGCVGFPECEVICEQDLSNKMEQKDEILRLSYTDSGKKALPRLLLQKYL
ncbi:hypothetical protein BuS5_01593 [Desulfosarcina sp. BuS5]|uniref:hypothetical protein n=1 Tax=Desulfosarcina sp. BuS5 TaxID=933262 RepID=UPI000486EA31|nr:hypothetical protein [Desulfosarcina sp. BuS5]WDN88625.1 hypothetical protein BuS5_01593 [Desulfosarcina sp. BuS5]